MSTREKVILSFAVIALIVGGYLYFFDSSESVIKLKDSTVNVDELKGYVSEKMGELEGDEYSEKDSYVIEMATTPWERDPFSNAENLDSISDAPPNSDLNFRYSGYVQIGGNLLAIINGIEYQIGEELGNPSYIVDSISPEKVGVKVGKRKMIYLPLEETM